MNPKKPRFFISIKYKLAILISLLLIASMIGSGYFLVDQKKRELEEDVWKNALQFSELATKPILDSYKLHYLSGSTFDFEQRLRNNLALNEDITSIKVANFNGEVTANYQATKGGGIENVGEEIVDQRTRQIIQDVKPALITDERVVFIKMANNEDRLFVNAQEQQVIPIGPGERVEKIIYPGDDNNFRLIYAVSYELLDQRIAESVKTIIYILIIIAASGLLIAILFAQRLVVPLLKLTRGVGKIAKGNLETRVEVKSRDETAILATAFNQMAADLEKSVETKIAHESMLKELEIAKRIQMGQIPKKPPEIQGLEIVFSLEPAAEVGGDCYDFLRLSDGNYFFHIGDATGHGIPASLVVALGNAALYGGALRLTDPKEIIDRSNEILFAKTEANMFLTSVGCHYEVASQKITFVQAGHDEILQFSKQTKELNLLKRGGMALGMMPDLSAMTEKVEVEWQSGDLLFFYTDGFPEAYQDIEVQLGMDQFKAIIQKYADLDNLEEMKSGIIKDVKEYMGSYPQNDDMTLMIVRKV